jgi:hypothetical protein
MDFLCTGVKMDNDDDNKLMTVFLLVGLLMLPMSSAENVDFKNCCVWQHMMSVGNLSELQCQEIFRRNLLPSSNF